MPVRLLNSAVLKWPDRDQALANIREWALKTGQKDSNIKKICCFGSLASGKWGVGSDADIMIEIDSSHEPFMRRGLLYNTDKICVPADILIYTSAELDRMRDENTRMIRVLDHDSIVLYRR